MGIFSVCIWFLVGLIIIVKCSDIFLDSAIWFARAFHVSDIVIGATIVSICTTLPEAVISIHSSYKNMPELAFGNAVGSIACNTGLVMALGIVLTTPRFYSKKSYQRNVLILIGTLFGALLLVEITGEINRLAGMGFLGVLIWYLFSNVKRGMREKGEINQRPVRKTRNMILLHGVFLILSGIGIALGSSILVDSGKTIARSLGVTEMVIGITMTAMGSSLPELVTCITAISKKAHNISVGNIIGADILNVCLVIGGASVVNPIAISKTDALFHLSAILAIAVIALLASVGKNRFERRDGVKLFVLYLVYLSLGITIFS